MSVKVPASAVGEWEALQVALGGAARSVPCRTVDVELWWEEDGERRAAALCQACPVLGECAAYAVAADERWGVWGGSSPSARKRARGRAA